MEYTVEFRKSVVINHDVTQTIIVFSCQKYKDSLYAMVPLIINRYEDGFMECRHHEYFACSEKYYNDDYVIQSIIGPKEDNKIKWSHS